MTVRETALAAHREREAERRREARRREAREDARAAAAALQRQREVAELLAANPLTEWFPGESWDVMDHARLGAAAGYGGGIVLADSKREVYVLLQFDRAPDGTVWSPPRAYAVELLRDRDTQYGYWSGPEVRSAADLGRHIAARENRAERSETGVR